MDKKFIVLIIYLIDLCVLIGNLSAQDHKVQVAFYALDEVSSNEIHLITNGIEEYYGFDIIFISLPNYIKRLSMIDNGIIYAKPFLDTLNDHYEMPSEEIEKVILLTSRKLTISPLSSANFSDLKWLIRGYANINTSPRKFAIVSTYKLKHEVATDSTYHHLLVKTVRHELGHLLGLDHCGNEGCLMVSGMDNRIFYNLDYKFCEKCLYQLCIEGNKCK